MSFLIAFFGMRGAIGVAILSGLLLLSTLTLGGAAGWFWFESKAAIIARDNAVNASNSAANDLAACLGANASAAAAERARAALAVESARVYHAALENARKAVEAARAGRAAAEAELATWRREWGEKTPQCAAALNNLNDACPELQRY